MQPKAAWRLKWRLRLPRICSALASAPRHFVDAEAGANSLCIVLSLDKVNTLCIVLSQRQFQLNDF